MRQWAGPNSLPTKRSWRGCQKARWLRQKLRLKAEELEGYLLTLDIPSYLPVMTYCDNQALREEMYRAYAAPAPPIKVRTPVSGTATKVMEEILALRHELAQLLGFENYAFKSLATKMAERPAAGAGLS
ncbi:M3 family metallopeptidase [Escherichia coli]|nr:M3 family metallopeptidase [Escherichia coli]